MKKSCTQHLLHAGIFFPKGFQPAPLGAVGPEVGVLPKVDTVSGVSDVMVGCAAFVYLKVTGAVTSQFGVSTVTSTEPAAWKRK